MNQENFRCELLRVPGADNVRDIGGYPVANGRLVNYRRFIRAGDMSGLTTDGVKAVRELGISCIIDLRSTTEVTRCPDTLAGDVAIRYVHIPMLDYIQSSIASGDVSVFPASITDMYRGLLEDGKSDLLRVFQVFADPAYRTVLFHCTAGKDRTGISAMLLLALAGVDREDIQVDYSYSEKLINFPINPELPSYLFQSKPETIGAAMDHLEEVYGGAQAYLSHIGVDNAMQGAVLRKLLG